jgi:hypothetical protein
MNHIAQPLQTFFDNLAPMLPADFAAPVRAIDAGKANIEKSGSGDLPVRRYWPAVMAKGGKFIDPLASLAPYYRWVQTSNYVASPPNPTFLPNYGYVVLAGPGGLVESTELALGFLLLGPETHYPSHQHPAVEIYVVAAGTAEWRKGDDPWRVEPVGSVIRHETMMPHATRTLAEPLLAIYIWQGDLKTNARIIAR